MQENVYGVLLAGGAGTRLWPISRQSFPKQLVAFFGGRSLIQHTVDRLAPKISADRIFVVCGEDHAEGISVHLKGCGLDPSGRVLAEPCGRNTAPAILLATLTIQTLAEDPILCIFPADHVIRETAVFHDTLETAVQLAEKGQIVTFGIEPTYPETGYGYIQAGASVDGGARCVRRFVEKPDSATARRYVDSGDFYWNSGMFVFKASVICEEFRRFGLGMFNRLSAMIEGGETEIRTGYPSLENISIDYAVMEKTDRCVVVPSGFGWSDIGSWNSLYDFLDKDREGNAVQGDVVLRNTTGSLVISTHRLVTVNGLSNAVVVDAPDALFVSNLETSRDVKAIVEQLKEMPAFRHLK